MVRKRQMNDHNEIQTYLNNQRDVAAWYAEYDDRHESIVYANGVFAEIFGIPVEQILARKRYHLVNPADTPEHVIEQYKDEDLQAIQDGCLFARSSTEDGQTIDVVKLRLDDGVLGLFTIRDELVTREASELSDLDPALSDVVRHIRSELLDGR